MLCLQYLVSKVEVTVRLVQYRSLYHGAWTIAMVTFDVPVGDICRNMPVDRDI